MSKRETHLILLGGRNIDQQQWIREVEKELSSYFKATHVLDYQHWKRGTVVEDVLTEAENLTALVDSIGQETDYAIFAKSMGTLVAAEAIKQRRISPYFCMFAGTPITSPFPHGDNVRRRIEHLFRNYQTPTLFLQNLDEKFMEAGELEDTLELLGVKNFEVAPGGGKIHQYSVDKICGAMFYLALLATERDGIFAISN